MGDQSTFISTFGDLAKKTAGALGAPANSDAYNAVLTQWGDESAWGTSSLAKRGNNLAGITCGGGCPHGWCGDGHYCYYSSPENFALGYKATLSASYYQPVRDAFSSGNSVGIVKAIQSSPWAEGHYNGHDLENLLRSVVGLPPSVPSPTPGTGTGTGTGGTGGTGSQFPALNLFDPSTWIGAAENVIYDLGAVFFANLIGLGILAVGVWLLFRETAVQEAIKNATSIQEEITEGDKTAKRKGKIAKLIKSGEKMAEVAAVA